MHDEGLGLYFWKKSYVRENVHPAWPAIHAGAQHSHTYRHNALHPITGLQGCIDSSIYLATTNNHAEQHDSKTRPCTNII